MHVHGAVHCQTRTERCKLPIFISFFSFRLYLKDSLKVNGHVSGEFPGRVDETKGK